MAESNQKESNSKTQQQKTKKAIALLTQFCKYLSLHFMKTISTKFDNKCSLNSNTIFFSCPLTCSYNPNSMSLLLACYVYHVLFVKIECSLSLLRLRLHVVDVSYALLHYINNWFWKSGYRFVFTRFFYEQRFFHRAQCCLTC